MREITLRIDNMHCGACIRHVSVALAAVPGIQVSDVRVGAARVRAPEDLPEDALLDAVQKAGYLALIER